MGNTWTIEVWGMHDPSNDKFSNEEYWRGQSFFEMLWMMYKAKKKENYGCVKLYWRGN